jgi:TonB family protein
LTQNNMTIINVRFLIIALFVSLSITGICHAERDLVSIKAIAKANREKLLEPASASDSEERRRQLFADAQIIFPDATNLPTIDDVRRAWVGPKPLKLLRPYYPREMMAKGTQGDVEIAYLIDEEGLVVDTFIIESSDEGFNKSLQFNVLHFWRFTPATIDGRPCKSVGIAPIKFRMAEESK